jgi:hypothetical protein
MRLKPFKVCAISASGYFFFLCVCNDFDNAFTTLALTKLQNSTSVKAKKVNHCNEGLFDIDSRSSVGNW